MTEPSSEKLKLTRSQNVLSAWILLFVVVAAPFPFGSIDRTTIAFWCILLSVAVILMSTRDLRREQLWIMAGLTIIVAGYGLVLHEQLADHPWIAPFHPVWKQASEALDIPLTHSASIVRNEPYFALGAPLANIMALLLGAVIGGERARARQILIAIAISGSLYALYGVLSFLIEPTMLLWRDKDAYLGSVTGTFINRNTAAVYFGSCCVIWLLLLIEKIREKIPERRIVWKKLFRRLSGLSPKEFLPIFGGFLICIVALFMTVSRAGVGLSLLALIGAFTIFLRKDLPGKMGIWISLAAGGAVALGLLEFLGGRVSSRFDSQGLADEGRIAALKSSWRIILDNPWFGTGMGTYPWDFTAYRSSEISVVGIWKLAHTTPLELAAEVGLPLAGMIALGWILMLLIFVRGIQVRRSDVVLPLASLATACVTLLHSSMDFSLQTPGFTLPFFTLFGAGLAQSFRSSRRSESREWVYSPRNPAPDFERDKQSHVIPTENHGVNGRASARRC